MKIIWSDFAITQLDEIYAYYEQIASPEVAKKMLRGIINEPEILTHSPLMGQEEELLKEREIGYRYIIFRNFKLIYSIDSENGFIKIADIFDTRQNPIKIKRTK